MDIQGEEDRSDRLQCNTFTEAKFMQGILISGGIMVSEKLHSKEESA